MFHVTMEHQHKSFFSLNSPVTVVSVPEDPDGAATNLQCSGPSVAAPHHPPWGKGSHTGIRKCHGTSHELAHHSSNT